MKTIILHGELGKVVGAKWRLDVRTPAEALRAIEANTGKLYKYLKENDGGFTEYRILLDDQDWKGVEELIIPIKTFETVHFIPVIKGSGSSQGAWMTVIGVLLLVVAAVLVASGVGAPAGGYTAVLGSTFLGGLVGGGLPTLLLTAGAALTLGGISSLLTPSVASGSGEKIVNRPSYLFNGPLNTYQQGNPVPILYGFLLVGSQVVSAGVRSTDLPTLTFWNKTVRYAVGVQVQYNKRFYESQHDTDLAPNRGHTPPSLPLLEDAGGWWKDVTDQ